MSAPCPPGHLQVRCEPLNRHTPVMRLCVPEFFSVTQLLRAMRARLPALAPDTGLFARPFAPGRPLAPFLYGGNLRASQWHALELGPCVGPGPLRVQYLCHDIAPADLLRVERRLGVGCSGAAKN